ncbi:protein of unknown function [Desulfonispora thiosulfatigenes DSM 11270]|uniref:DUF4911 domain-containing protein n=1 Tax=Desulfonispora thiosulfatigenes DSM 11270 TaxID=656914 RepID=A0A1W1VQN5_DESTI|nr:DUF4911 domain-containing protein [Desulfonispora thiosulfatigenes]SMB95583.1 protein of unknown function [Desulfonispora thiosulfatigenes DSM 11270]
MSYIINLRVNPKDISFINKIFEAYNGLALVTTIDSKLGLIKVNATPQTVYDVKEILQNLPKQIEFL